MAKEKQLEKTLKEKENSFALNLIENFQFGLDKNIQTMMLESGYTLDEVQEYDPIIKQANENLYLKDFVDKLNKTKRAALQHVTETKLEQTNAKDLTIIVDTLNKTEQLLRGNATHRIDLNKNFTDDTRYRTILREALIDCEGGDEEEPTGLLHVDSEQISGELAPPDNWTEADGSGQKGKE